MITEALIAEATVAAHRAICDLEQQTGMCAMPRPAAAAAVSAVAPLLFAAGWEAGVREAREAVEQAEEWRDTFGAAAAARALAAVDALFTDRREPDRLLGSDG